MEASSAFQSFKSKKIHRSSSSKSPASDEKTRSAPTGVPATPLRRSVRCLMSVKAVREAATKLRSSSGPKARPDPIFSEELGKGPTRKPKKKKADEANDLPEKYGLLCKFFDSLDSSLRLLRMKKYTPSLKNITPQIECLTERRFSIAHLAQLKFILPEAIELKKVLVHDEKTFCMKPDIHVTLNLSAIINDATIKPDLKSIFRARVLNFIKAHPEEEVPEGQLPEPFNRSIINTTSCSEKASSSTLLNETSAEAVLEKPATSASHLPETFQKRFSKQVSPQSVSKSGGKLFTPDRSSFLGDSQAITSFSRLPETPIKDHLKNNVSSYEGTPSKVTSTPGKLMSVTPALAPPKRSYMTPEGDSVNSPNKFVRRPPRTRSLIFDTPVKSAKVEDEVKISSGDLSSDDDNILPTSLLQSIREKELKIREENDPTISQAKRRQQLISSLPKFFDMIRYSFQSSKSCVVTKVELVHKLMTSQLDITDRKEVEEQLDLLKELVPELIHEKFSSSGDLLIGINKISSPELIRARLVEAKSETSNQIRF